MRFLLLWFILNGSPSGSATISTQLASCQQTRPLPLARHRNALSSGPAPLKSPSRKFTPNHHRSFGLGEQRLSSQPPRPLRSAIGLSDLRDPPSREPIGGHVGKVELPPCPSLLRPAQHFRLRVASLRSASGQARYCRLFSVFRPEIVRPGFSDLGSSDTPPCERHFMTRTQRFRFREEPGPGADGAVLEVRVPEVLHVQYGMYVWPCAVVLAQYLWFHRRALPGKAVLEIGAGVSLPGILAAKCGAEVTLSDSSELPHCLDICRQSCQMNNLPQVQVVGVTWGHISKDLLSLPPQDIILASDVFFEPEDFENILATVYFLMQRNPKVQFWSTYQVRSADWSLEGLLYKWDMKCVHIPLESFDADKEDIAESTLPGRHTVEMLAISFAK